MCALGMCCVGTRRVLKGYPLGTQMLIHMSMHGYLVSWERTNHLRDATEQQWCGAPAPTLALSGMNGSVEQTVNVTLRAAKDCSEACLAECDGH